MKSQISSDYATCSYVPNITTAVICEQITSFKDLQIIWQNSAILVANPIQLVSFLMLEVMTLKKSYDHCVFEES